MSYIPFTRPSIDEDTIRGVVEVLRSGWVASGPQVLKFEAALGEYAIMHFDHRNPGPASFPQGQSVPAWQGIEWDFGYEWQLGLLQLKVVCLASMSLVRGAIDRRAREGGALREGTPERQFMC